MPRCGRKKVWRSNRARGDDRGIGVALNNLGVIAHEQGNLELAEHRYSKSLANARRRRAPADVAFSLNNLGSIAELRRDVARAITLHTESLDLYLELGDRWGAAVTRMNLGLEWLESGQIEQASNLLREALQDLTTLGDRRNAGRGDELPGTRHLGRGRSRTRAYAVRGGRGPVRQPGSATTTR